MGGARLAARSYGIRNGFCVFPAESAQYYSKSNWSTRPRSCTHNAGSQPHTKRFIFSFQTNFPFTFSVIIFLIFSTGQIATTENECVLAHSLLNHRHAAFQSLTSTLALLIA